MIHGGDIYRNQVELDFSVNINPFGMPEQVKEELIQAVSLCEQYPDIGSKALTGAIAQRLGIERGGIVCGNGASELFIAILQALRPKKVILPVPSFYGYEHAAAAAGSELLFYQMTEQDGFGLTEEFVNVLTDEGGLVFLANPNNPTGGVVEPALLIKIADTCKQKRMTLVLDECFIAFTGDEQRYSFLPQLASYPNVIIVQAFTKLFAMPGVRLGYLICADETLAESIRRVLPEWNVSVPAQRAGIAACREREYVKESIRFVQCEREWLAGQLRGLGISVFDSKSNYLLLYTECPLYKSLLARRILIRDCSNFAGLKTGYYRVAVKRRRENERLCAAIAQILAGEDGSVEPVSTERLAIADAAAAQIEYVLPGDIEKRSFSIIEQELARRCVVLPPQEAPVTKRVIHTSADFSYAETMTYTRDALETAKNLIQSGADIVTDTNMALSGINKTALSRHGGRAHCFMADQDVAAEASERGITRAAVSMERASRIGKPLIFAVGNAPTALIQLYEMITAGIYRPAFIIGVPVGFVNVEAAKELIQQTDVPYIINRGRKGGSNVAAAICNAILYELGRE